MIRNTSSYFILIFSPILSHLPVVGRIKALAEIASLSFNVAMPEMPNVIGVGGEAARLCVTAGEQREPAVHMHL